MRSNIKHSTQCFITRGNTSKFVKNAPLHIIFSTLFSAFHLVMKHCFSCLIYYINNPILSQNWGVQNNVPSWKYELTVEIISGKVCRNNGRTPAWAWTLPTSSRNIFWVHCFCVCCKVLHKRFQSKIEEENMTQLGWYHLCKNDYF